MSKSPNKIRMLSRQSNLALAQANIAKQLLETKNKNLTVEIVPILSTGDQVSGNLQKHGGKDLFVNNLRQELLANRADCACHSLKDIGYTSNEFNLAAFLPREDYRDALVGSTLEKLRQKENPIIATSSPRRAAQLLQNIPNAKIVPMRGNVDTRLKKLNDENIDALVLAVAGLNRLNLSDKIAEKLDPNKFIPAAGQGTIVLETLTSNKELGEILSAIDDQTTRKVSMCERSCIENLNADCFTPIGVLAKLQSDNKINVNASLYYQAQIANANLIEADPLLAGKEVSNNLLVAGGREILAKIASDNKS